MPIWSLCGTKDSYFAGAQAMADGMKQVGATAFTFTKLEGVGHSINDRGYDYPGFIDWMFAQRRTDAPSSGGAGAGGLGGATAGGAHGGTAGASGGAEAASGGTAGASGDTSGASGGVSSEGGALGVAGASGGTSAAGAGSTLGGAAASGGGAAGASDDGAESTSGCSIASSTQIPNPSARVAALVLLASVAWRRNQRRARRSGGGR